ncbi:MAG: GntR family transcriptional regulator, partial [Nocardioidaceae bacterium]|nr:GntR family transcriptional regulator [Nocardioidaceae bacterium]
MMQDDAFADMPDLSAPGDDPAHARIEKWLVGLVAGGDLVEGD